MSKLKLGNKVPDFSLPMTGGGTWSLKDAAGGKLVIYFYPRDMTAGCTRESQDFRDLAAAFRRHVGEALPSGLLASIDSALSAAVEDPNDQARGDALIGLRSDTHGAGGASTRR